MLVRLYGKNFRSLRDSFELSMVAADLKREEDQNRGVVEVPIKGAEKPLRILRTAAIYGPNGSGKSTVLTAARALRWLGLESSLRSKPDSPIPPYEPFLLDEATSSSPIELGCDVVLQKSILRYVVQYTQKRIVGESLCLLDGKKEKTLFERLPSGEVQGSLITKRGANQLYVREMQPNVAVLAKLAQHGPSRGRESVHAYYRAIHNATDWQDYSIAASYMFGRSTRHEDRFADDGGYRDWIMSHLMRVADVGISDVRTHREGISLPDSIREQFEKQGEGFKLPTERVVVSFVHDGKASSPIDFTDESSGTKKLFNISGDWWRLANEPVTLFADELSASLHPRLLDRLIRSVNDLPEGRAQSQLIFTTHDTGLLESLDGLPPALRRDQVYFTKKDVEGSCSLYSLAEFKDDARPVHNLRKRYLSGLYGALPSVEKLSL
ncbi:MAG: AAA family ATPase [Gemmataceae bacterium]